MSRIIKKLREDINWGMSGAPVNYRKGCGILLALLILFNAGGALLESIVDPDLFWHLKSGEWIWEHRALPGEYLFAITPPDTPPQTQRFLMTSYWLAQVCLHLVQAAGGLPAIIAVRFALFALLLLPLFFRRRDGDPIILLGLLVFAVAVLASYPQERPQYFSFVFAGFLLWLLEGFRTAGTPAALRRRAAAIPLLMLVWAQCHGGYVVGVGFIALVLLGETLKRLHPRLEPLPAERWRLLLASGVAGFLASCLNPNGVYVFRIAQAPAWVSEVVTEYQSTIEIFRYSGDPGILAYWLLLGLTAVGLALSWRGIDVTTLLLAAVTGYFSFVHIRFIAFFIVVAVPAACRTLSLPGILRPARAAIVAAGLGAGAFLLKDAAPKYLEIAHVGTVNPQVLPVEAADFIVREGLRGNVYNLYDWGGYLIWRLGPTGFFIDGRGADQNRYEVYRMILTGQPGPWGPIWKAAFATNRIRLTVTDFFNPYSGEFRRLVDNLLADPAWVPVFASPSTVVFVEEGPENRGVIRRNALSKERFYGTLNGYCSEIIESSPDFVPAYVAQGDIQMRLGNRPAALRSYLAALEIAPEHKLARTRVAELTAKGGT